MAAPSTLSPQREGVSFEGPSHLIYRQGPWRLVLPIVPISLSPTMFLAELDFRQLPQWEAEDVRFLLQESRDYTLQLEHDVNDIGFQVVPVTLLQLDPCAVGFRMTLAFTEPHSEITAIYQALCAHHP